MDDLFNTLENFEECIKPNKCDDGSDCVSACGSAKELCEMAQLCRMKMAEIVSQYSVKYWEDNVAKLHEKNKCIEKIRVAGQWKPRNFPAIIAEYSDYFKGLMSFSNIVFSVTESDGISKEAISAKVDIVKEKNKDAVKDIVKDPRYDMEVTMDNVIDSYSSFPELMAALDELTNVICDFTKKIIDQCEGGVDVYATEPMCCILKIIGKTHVKFFHKTLKKLIELPKDFEKACEEADEELAPKRVF